jgi:hypothetical protein
MNGLSGYIDSKQGAIGGKHQAKPSEAIFPAVSSIYL